LRCKNCRLLAAKESLYRAVLMIELQITRGIKQKTIEFKNYLFASLTTPNIVQKRQLFCCTHAGLLSDDEKQPNMYLRASIKSLCRCSNNESLCNLSG
jgi:hypothetical protein